MADIKALKKSYTLAKSVKVNDTAICPSCKTPFIKTNYQQAFCKNKVGTMCKDFYWNNVTPNKRNNTTRISSANAAFMSKMDRIRESNDDYDDDQSWDAHKNY